ncbi:MAG: OsmC family protein [Candidatus Phytoplasma pruni]|nr:OsmC family protein [Candidatus Phytoplasma pruni]
MSQLKLIAYHDERLNDIGIVKNGLKTKLDSALTNANDNYSDPRELMSLSLLVCVYKTTKKYLALKKPHLSDIKIKASTSTSKDEQGFYFKLELIMGIKEASVQETTEIMDTVHTKCPVSRMLNDYPHLILSAVLYESIA